jgi:hypothetical protein
MSLRSDIHAAMDAISEPVPHLPFAVRNAIRDGEPPRATKRPSARLAVAGILVVVTAAVVGVWSLASHQAALHRSAAQPMAQCLAPTEDAVVGGFRNGPTDDGFRTGQVDVNQSVVVYDLHVQKGGCVVLDAGTDPQGNVDVVVVDLGSGRQVADVHVDGLPGGLGALRSYEMPIAPADTEWQVSVVSRATHTSEWRMQAFRAWGPGARNWAVR